MIDLTTLEDADSPGKVRQMCYKAAHLHDALPGVPHASRPSASIRRWSAWRKERCRARASTSPPSRLGFPPASIR